MIWNCGSGEGREKEDEIPGCDRLTPMGIDKRSKASFCTDALYLAGYCTNLPYTLHSSSGADVLRCCETGGCLTPGEIRGQTIIVLLFLLLLTRVPFCITLRL